MQHHAEHGTGDVRSVLASTRLAVEFDAASSQLRERVCVCDCLDA